jgi:hypothetical protein
MADKNDVPMMTFSDYDLEKVSKATTWMRAVSSLIYFFAALQLALLIYRLIRFGVGDTISLSVSSGTIVVLILGGVFLRKACIVFYEGIAESSETPLAAGFRQLRVFWVFFALFCLMGLGSTAFYSLRMFGLF